MKILVIGSGGREHTLVWKISQSSKITKIFWAPGNPAAPVDPKVEIRSIKSEDVQALASFAQTEKIDLTIVGPEVPLVAGVGDEFRKRGLKIFGPSRQGAQLEGSKVFSKQFFLKHEIPTGKATAFSDLNKALEHARKHPKPLVVKADGLAAGKGVLICKNDVDVEQGLREIMEQKVFGDAGCQVLIEECLTGPEVSVHAITDGRNYQILASAQDHKRALDNDQGLNTGGMGTYSPAPFFTPELEKRVRTEIFDRTMKGLQADGIPYCGVLYAGLMLTADGPKIIEYNCRFGDPETQVIFTRLETDLVDVLLAACDGKLDTISLKWKKEASVCVVLAAGGYPSNYRKGDSISGLDTQIKDQTYVFHAGTSLQGKNVITSGGRVLGITAIGKNLREAAHKAYRTVDIISFEGKHFRRDIAAQALR
jgi:phosphoribosylamine--glycine ligase